ncbi:hypothetical protein UFOVP1360_17 [uncultured Caudovirales phage]|uniref:Uncharacterized protein n=1 Tax=uncultured Caudovirales phage TaxID=2100421 RepID=A0A6J5S1L1_9CAUD|nr:hypothetical protein UFOVP1360_17 [uncultured Caudovirales phage]
MSDALDDLNESANEAGGKWVNLNTEGQKIGGLLIGSQKRGKTFDGMPVYTKASMNNPDPSKRKQREELVLTLQTTEHDDDDPTDDGIRKVTLDEGGMMAMGKAKRDLGRGFLLGDFVKLRVTKSSVQGKSGADIEAKVDESLSQHPTSASADAANGSTDAADDEDW